MAKAPTEIRSLARSHTEQALNVLVGIMGSTEVPHAARVSAAIYVIDRGWGKPKQALGGEGDDEAITIIQRIERIIVDAPKAEQP